ncbi:MAG: hypothetical protein AAFO95_19695 [Cyanobacteria bacterium J06600_6]
MIERFKIRIYGTASIIGTVIIAVQLGTVNDVQASADADYSFLIDSDWRNCQQISTEYQEVYAFETDSFYVNICSQNNTYFYSGEAKQTGTSSIFIPALPLEDNRGFKAINGNLSYVVILPFSGQNEAESLAVNPKEAILTIKRNGQLVEVESSLNKYCHQSKAIAFDNLEPNAQNFNRLATIFPQQDINENLLSKEIEAVLPKEIFNSESHFDFYRIDGKIHRLATCNQ